MAIKKFGRALPLMPLFKTNLVVTHGSFNSLWKTSSFLLSLIYNIKVVSTAVIVRNANHILKPINTGCKTYMVVVYESFNIYNSISNAYWENYSYFVIK